MNIVTGATRVIAPPTIRVIDGSLGGWRVVTPGTLQISGVANDANVEVWSVGSQVLEPQLLCADPRVTPVSLTPSVATIAANGKVTFVSEGTARFRFAGLTTREIPVVLQPAPGTTERRPVSWVTGSLARHLFDDIHGRTTGSGTLAETEIFSAANHQTSAYTRNGSAWFAGIAGKLTGLPVWNSVHGTSFAGAAITPQHLINAAHAPLPVGAVVRWVAADGAVHERTIVGTAIDPAYSSAWVHPDWQICTLNSALPTAIAPVRVPQATLPVKIPNDSTTGSSWGPPVLVRSSANRLYIGSASLNTSLGREYVGAWTPRHLSASRAGYWSAPVFGDSGSPIVAMIGGEPVLLTVLTAAAGWGTDLSQHLTELQQGIADADTAAGISSGRTLTVQDLSGFPSYT
jgi:hypothetical protein